MASTKPDHWSSSAYNSAAGFVPKLTTKVIQHLDPASTDRILDIGCGDGQLTATIASHLTDSSSRALGLDASPSFISTAQKSNQAPNCTYALHDCSQLASYPALEPGTWDKVFSNAAMHWILRSPSSREPFFRDVFATLKPGGRFVFEMGGAGNVAEIQTAFTAALNAVGELSVEQARDASPWFFPSDTWMNETLTRAGFDVEVCELEYRPTKLTDEKADGSGGLEGWVRLMGAQFLDAVEEGKRQDVVKRVCEWVESIVRRDEDGSRWIGYVRLRAVARKSA